MFEDHVNDCFSIIKHVYIFYLRALSRKMWGLCEMHMDPLKILRLGVHSSLECIFSYLSFKKKPNSVQEGPLPKPTVKLLPHNNSPN